MTVDDTAPESAIPETPSQPEQKAEETAATETQASAAAASEPEASEPAKTDTKASEPAASEPSASEPSASEPAASEPSASESSKPDSEAPAQAAEPAEPDGSSFAGLGLIEPLLKALDDVGYETPSPIQASTIPPILAGRDVVGQAQTGTGKTAAFALPLLSRLAPQLKTPQVLVLTPTRELALQVAEAFQRYAVHMKGFRVLPIYGGQAYEGQLRQLRRGVHVVVGTPGRVMDHMRRETLDLSALKCLVLDEADEMLRMGFIEDVEWILEKTPPERQVALFSATMPHQVRRIAQRHLKEPQEITIKVKTTTADTIRQRYWTVSGLHKLDALTRILEAESFDAMIVFVRTKTATMELAEKLGARGFAAAAINGDMAQQARERTVDRLKTGKLDILVATDVAARGLDVERISHVVNYDIPYDTDSYVHRVGRTGRAGREGQAILFVSPRERRMLRSIEQATRQRIERMELPSTEVINDRRVLRFKQNITDTLAKEEWRFFYDLLEQYQTEHDVPALEIAAALAKLLQGDEPLLLAPPRRHERTPARERHDRSRPTPAPPEGGMERYRLEVGRAHGVQPKNIVGALTNEADIEGRHLGRIHIYDDFSTIDLPEGMPREIFRMLKRVRVCGQALRISKMGGPESADQDRGPRRDGPDKRQYAKRPFKKERPFKKGGRSDDRRDRRDDRDSRPPRDQRPSRDQRPGGPKGERSTPARYARFTEKPEPRSEEIVVTHRPEPGERRPPRPGAEDGGYQPRRKKPRWSPAKKRAHKMKRKKK